MDSNQEFISYLASLDENYYLFLASSVLGKIPSPFHRPNLSQSILKFLLNKDIQFNILSSLDKTASSYITLIMLLGGASNQSLHNFFINDSYPVLLSKLENLCDRLVLIKQKGEKEVLYKINPVLKDSLESNIFDKNLITQLDKAIKEPCVFVDKNIVFALINLLSNGSVPTREANAHLFIKSEKLQKVFPSFDKESIINVYEIIKDYLLSSSAIYIINGQFRINQDKIKTILELDNLSLCINALENKYNGIAQGLVNALNLITDCSMKIDSFTRLLSVFCAKEGLDYSLLTNDLVSMGLIVKKDDCVALNMQVLKAQDSRSTLQTDSDLIVSYYGQANETDILYLFADIEICDKLISYRITKDSFTRALEYGLTTQAITDYLDCRTSFINNAFDSWQRAFSRLRMYDGIILQCEAQVSALIKVHPQLKQHIIQILDDNIIIMRRSTFSSWQADLAYALDLSHLPLPYGMEIVKEGSNIFESASYQLIQTNTNSEKLSLDSWDNIKSSLLESAQKKGILNDNVKELIEAKLIMSESQLSKDFKYPVLPTYSGFDYNAKLTALKNALKSANPVLRLELTDETFIVKPLELIKGKDNSYLKASILPEGLERNISVSSIFKITVLLSYC